MTGARPVDGSSSSSHFGWVISAMPSASICCSPPLSEPARCGRALVSTGKQLVDLRDEGGVVQQTGDRQGFARPTGSGTRCVPAARRRSPAAPFCGIAGRDGVRRRTRPALARRVRADDAFQQRGLAGAVVAEDANPRALGAGRVEMSLKRRQGRHRTPSGSQSASMRCTSMPEIEFGELRFGDQLFHRCRAREFALEHEHALVQRSRMNATLCSTTQTARRSPPLRAPRAAWLVELGLRRRPSARRAAAARVVHQRPRQAHQLLLAKGRSPTDLFAVPPSPHALQDLAAPFRELPRSGPHLAGRPNSTLVSRSPG